MSVVLMAEKEFLFLHHEDEGNTHLVDAEVHWRMPPSPLAGMSILGHLHTTLVTAAKAPWPRYSPSPPMFASTSTFSTSPLSPLLSTPSISVLLRPSSFLIWTVGSLPIGDLATRLAPSNATSISLREIFLKPQLLSAQKPAMAPHS